MNINNVQINGPNNVVRLTDGKKILYILGDCHVDLDEQTECKFDANKDIIDIDKLLFKFISTEKKNNFDIFLECDDKLFTMKKDNINKKIYINEVQQMLSFFVKYEDNKVVINNNYPNFKFHYMDIRNYIEYQSKYIKLCCFYNYNYDSIKYRLDIAETNLKFLQEYKLYLLGNTNKYINKILNIYNNKYIGKKINFLFNKIVIKNLDILIKNHDIYIEYLKTINNKIFLKKSVFISYKINLFINKLNLSYLLLNAIITDLYFIRRFLDKDYVNNSILYTGMFHFVDIMYILVKYFNFTVTHIYWTTNNYNLSNISKIKIKKFRNLVFVRNEFTHYNKKNDIIQCINLTNFPINFT